jgi:hypothetical protein
MSSRLMALVRRNMYERLTRQQNEVVILIHLLVFYKNITFVLFQINLKERRTPHIQLN